MIQEQHGFCRALAASKSRESRLVEIIDGLGHLRLFGSQKLPELLPMDVENDDPTSLGVVTLRR